MHGLGASGHDFEPIVPVLKLPQVRFVFPHAPARGVTINGGLIMPAWYDILALATAGGEDADDVRESATMIEALIAREAARGVPSERVVLAGFSQGGAMALPRHPRSDGEHLARAGRLRGVRRGPGRGAVAPVRDGTRGLPRRDRSHRGMALRALRPLD